MVQQNFAAKDISSNAAFKTLEVVLHSLEQNFSKTVDALQEDQNQLSTSQRLLLTQLDDSINHTKQLLRDALRHRAVIEHENFEHAEPGVAERIQVEKALFALASTTSTEDFSAFCKYCVKTLAELYDCQYAFIGILQAGGTQIQTIAVWAEHEHAENFVYDLAGTPCEDIINFNKELIPTNAALLYPEDGLLAQMQVDSYFGVPMVSKELGTIGLVSVMNTKPMQLNEWIAPVLGVFAARLVLENQRNSAIQKLQELNYQLEARVEQRTAELQETNQELQAFSYSVSHDLRTPVRTINSFLNILYEDHYDQIPVDALEHLGRIQRAGVKLNTLIDDLLGLARINGANIMVRNINITTIAQDTVEELLQLDPTRKVAITIEKDLVSLADAGLVRILMHNLLSNALKYTRAPNSTEIEIGTTQGEEITYFVRDNGIGFNIEYADKIFQPFQRLHNDSEFCGNGVGLATVQRIVHRHGGKIWVQTTMGQETVFFFTLSAQTPINVLSEVTQI